MDLVGLGDIDHGKQGIDRHPRQRFFLALARRTGLERFAVLQEAGRNGPVAAARLDRAPAQQDAPFIFDTQPTTMRGFS